MKPINLFGLIVFLISCLILIGFGIYELLSASDVALIVKIGTIGLFLGTIIILYSLIIERIKDKEKGE